MTQQVRWSRIEALFHTALKRPERDSKAWLENDAVEYVDGERLDAYCDSRRLSIEHRLQLFHRICEAVDYGHRNQIVHRDLKPSNILVTRDGAVKLLNFGKAALTAEDGGAALRSGVAADVFSLGVLLYELLTGAYPFGNPDSLLREIKRAMGEAAPAHLAAGLWPILRKALAHDPAHRYGSVRELLDDLTRYREGQPIEAAPAPRLAAVAHFLQQRRRTILASLVIVMAGVFARSYEAAARAQERIRQANEMYSLIVRQTDDIEARVAHDEPELASQIWSGLRDSVQRLQRDDPGNPGLRLIAAHTYMTLGRFAWFRYSNSLVNPDEALESYRHAVNLFDPAETRAALCRSAAPRIFATDVMIEKGLAFESFREVARVLPAMAFVRRTDPLSWQWPQIADFASYYDMLSDRLGANMRWPPPGDQSPAWYGHLAALHPNRATDAAALQLYEESMAKAGEAAGTVLIRFQLGRLEHQAGMKEQGIRVLRDALQAMLTTGEGGTRNRIARTYLRLGVAAEEDGDLAEADRNLEKAIETVVAPPNPYLKEVLGEALISRARVLAKLGRQAEALASAKRGIELLRANAQRPGAPATALDLAAQRLLTIEPAGARNPERALGFARQAVGQTAGQMPPYLVTLAFAQSAAGRDDEARQTAALAIEAYRRIAEVLAPAFDAVHCPAAESQYREWRDQLTSVRE